MSDAGGLAARPVLDALPVGVFVVDDGHVFRYANQELARINDRSVEDHLGTPLLEVLPSINPASYAAMLRVFETGVGEDDILVDRPGPERRSFSLSYRRVVLDDGRPVVLGTITDISARARAAQQGRELGERLGRLRDANVIGVIAGEANRVIDANGYVLTMLGLDPTELGDGALAWERFTPPEHAELHREMLDHLREVGPSPVFPREFLHADGHRVPVLVAGTAVSAEPFRWVLLVLDTSTVHRSERRAASLVRFGTALASARTLDEILELVPMLADPISGLVLTAVPVASVRVDPDPVGLAASTHAIQSFERDAERGFAVPIRDGSGVVAVVELVHHSGELDVLERSFATSLEALVSAAVTQLAFRSQQQLASIAGALDVMLDMVAIDTAIRDEAGRIVDFRVEWVNQATTDAFGRSSTDMIGGRMLELYPELAGSAFFAAHCAVVEDGTPFEDPEFVFDAAAPGIAPRVYELRVSKFGDGFISCSRDVTERAEAQRQVQRSAQRLDAAQALARMGSWEWNLDTGERVWSRELHRLLAIGDDLDPEDRHARAMERFHPDDRHLMDAAVDGAKAGEGPRRFDQRLVLPDGERIAVVTTEVISDERGRIFRGTLRDVTEWRRAQDESAWGRSALEAMQRACLPEVLPTAAGVEIAARYLPAHAEDRLGGDWYDAFGLPGGRLGLVVGDVTGHGLAAAAIMSQLRNALRAYALDGSSPAAVLDAVARFQLRSGSLGFATCLYVVLDPDGALTWSRAGHPPPVLVDGSGRWSAPEAGGRAPLGVIRGGYTDHRGVLAAGGTLVLYTDGLVEQRGASIDLGISRLAALVVDGRDLPLAQLVDDAVDRLGAASRGADDVCLLVLRRY